MKAGIHKDVKIVGSYTGMSPEKKTPFIAIEFENEEGESMDWVAWLTPKTDEKEGTAKRVLTTLVEIGFIGKSLADLSDPKKKMSDLFSAETPSGETIDLVVEDETYEDSEGNEKVKQIIKWVNVGNQGGLSKFDHATAVTTFKSLSFDGDLIGIKKDIGKPKSKTATEKKPPKETTAPVDATQGPQEDDPF